MITPVSSRGHFWIPGQADKPVAGTLTYSPEAGPVVELDGTFGDLMLVMQGGAEYPVVHGTTRDGEVTLLNVSQAGMHVSMPGTAREDLRCDQALLGACLDPNELTFSEVIIELDHLADWVQRTGITYDFAPSGNVKWRAEYRWVDAIEATLDDGTVVSAAFTASASPALGRFETTEKCYLKARLQEPTTLSDVIDPYVWPLRDFVSIATGAPNLLTKCVVHTPNRTRVRPGNVEEPIDLAVLARIIQPAADQIEPKPIHPVFQLFTLPDTPGGFATVIPAWMRLRGNAKDAIDLLIGDMLRPAFWFPNRVATVAQGLEAYHRLTHVEPGPDSPEVRRVSDVLEACPPDHKDWLTALLQHAHEPSLRQRLRDIVRRVQELVAPLVDDEAAYLKRLTNARNLQAHPGTRSRTDVTDPRQLYLAFSQSVWVLTANLMLDVGFSPETVKTLIQRNPRFTALLNVLSSA